jgi:lytic murein transglycosylase
MRPIFPALAALAWGEPRRRAYWEQELLNALVIVERGWGTPAEMNGSWAGAMGHTQWMPEVWLNMGFDYDGNGRVSPFGKPDDALGSTARYLVQRGKYRRGEHWGYEVRVPGGRGGSDASRSYADWQKAGVTRADGQAFPQGGASAKLWVPVPDGPAFLLGPNFYAVRSYNPSMNYTLSIVHLGDRAMGGEPFVQKFPGSERAPTLAEVQEIQRRLTALGYDTGGTDGRVGNDTMLAVRNFQKKIGMVPADGYAGVTLLARLREAR